MEIFLNRLHRFDMLDRRCMRPTPGHLEDIPPIYIILVAPTTLLAVSCTEKAPLCHWLHVLCSGVDENHHRYCGGQTSLCAEYDEPPIEPLISASKNGVEPTLLLSNVDI